MSEKTCSVDGCSRPVKARGWCSAHYSRWSRNGEPEAIHPSRLLKPCSVDDCADTVHGRGLCHKHYLRMKRSGSVDIDNPWYPTPDEAFGNRTARIGECLIWTGAKDSHGYGQIKIGKRHVYAHRWAWERENGPIPDGMVIDHSEHCDPACVEISHLRLATATQNKSHHAGANASNKSSGVRNVFRTRSGYGVRVQKNGKARHFGVYPTIEEAAIVAEAKRNELFGEFAGRGVGSRGWVKAPGGEDRE